MEPTIELLGAQSPFRSNLSRLEASVKVTGVLPEWLTGQVVRTAPAVFQAPGWQAGHWFDGLGMLYAFRFDAKGAVSFRQRLLESTMAKAPGKLASFGTSMQRGFFKRLFQPIPPQSDNTNVNILPYGDELVAMTETSTQWVVDPETLENKRTLHWEGDEPTNMLAHPHFDFERKVIVNVGTVFGRTSALSVFEHGPNERKRREIGRWELKRVPYVHSFGLTSKHAVLIAHPFDVSSLSMLWSNKGYIDHFKWSASQGTRIAVIDRSTGAVREHQTKALFTFHTVNSFEEGDTTVVDTIAYDDVEVLRHLSASAMSHGYPNLKSKLVRLRMTKGVDEATVTQLSDTFFEFPAIHYKQFAGRAYQTTWGASLWSPEGGALQSRIVKIDVATGRTARFEDPDFVFGEPLFVPKPDAKGEQDGVLLTVGSHRNEDRAALQILSAQSLESIARAEVDVPLPLGFHGSYLRGAGEHGQRPPQ